MGPSDISEEKLCNEVPIRLKISVTFDSESDARAAGEALMVDDDEFIKTTIDGIFVIAEVSSESIGSARRAADDWMACLIATRKDLERDRIGSN